LLGHLPKLTTSTLHGLATRRDRLLPNGTSRRAKSCRSRLCDPPCLLNSTHSPAHSAREDVEANIRRHVCRGSEAAGGQLLKLLLSGQFSQCPKQRPFISDAAL